MAVIPKDLQASFSSPPWATDNSEPALMPGKELRDTDALDKEAGAVSATPADAQEKMQALYSWVAMRNLDRYQIPRQLAGGKDLTLWERIVLLVQAETDKVRVALMERAPKPPLVVPEEYKPITDDDYKARMDGTTLWREPDVAPLDGTDDLYPNKRFRPAGDTDGIKGTMNADGTIKVEPAKVDRVLPDREPATFPTADEWDAYAEAERMKHPEAVITESVASILGKMTPAGISKQEKTMHEPKTTQDYIRESANARRVAKAAQLNTARTKGTFHWWYMPLREVGDGLYWKCLGKLHRIGLPPRMGAAYRKWKAS